MKKLLFMAFAAITLMAAECNPDSDYTIRLRIEGYPPLLGKKSIG